MNFADGDNMEHVCDTIGCMCTSCGFWVCHKTGGHLAVWDRLLGICKDVCCDLLGLV